MIFFTNPYLLMESRFLPSPQTLQRYVFELGSHAARNTNSHPGRCVLHVQLLDWISGGKRGQCPLTV